LLLTLKQDLRYLPNSRVENYWVSCASMQRSNAEGFDDNYMDVLRMRALEGLDVYEFEQ
jgi:hypothetical protein